MIIDKYLTTTIARKSTVLIYGAPVTGKTTGAMTFPNPYLIDFDGNISEGTKNVVPMWEATFVGKILPHHPLQEPDRCRALLKVYADFAHELPAGSTIITDSLTRIETWYNLYEDTDPKKPRGRDGTVDGFALFRARLNYFDTLFTILTSCSANVVFIVHQQQDRDEKGQVTGHIKPSLMGQIGEKLPGYFPVVLQAVRDVDKADKSKVKFLWRIRPGAYEPARVPKPVSVDFIPQDYNELAKLL